MGAPSEATPQQLRELTLRLAPTAKGLTGAARTRRPS